MSALVIFNHDRKVLTYMLTKAETGVGTGALNDLSIPADNLRGYHFSLVREGPSVRLVDRSGGGVQLNGSPVKDAVLKDGDALSFGAISIRFVESAAPAESGGTDAGGMTEVLAATGASPGDGGRAFLTIAGPGGRACEVGSAPVGIGSAADNDLRIGERFVSAHHCRVYRRDGVHRIVDLGSTNGTRVNGARIIDTALPDGARILIGRTEIGFERETGKTEAPVFHGMIGSSRAMKIVFDLVARVAGSDATALITGETGTGKELVARAIHDLSKRAQGPFIPINCAAIAKDVLESELFGHEKGAFTGAAAARKGAFEEADGGTLFLDEVGEIPTDIQTKILRTVEYGEIKRVGANRPARVSTRIVAATNRSLQEEVKAGRFREDLFYRLNVLPVRLPPLRERAGDVELIAARITMEMSGGAKSLSSGALGKLCEYQWPGNVRELKNVLTRALILSDSDTVQAEDCQFNPARLSDILEAGSSFPGGMSLAEIEKAAIMAELNRQDGHREKTAKALGIGLSTLKDKLKAWGMTGK
jgi:DNA-binding NtrC family response regulator